MSDIIHLLYSVYRNGITPLHIVVYIQKSPCLLCTMEMAMKHTRKIENNLTSSWKKLRIIDEIGAEINPEFEHSELSFSLDEYCLHNGDIDFHAVLKRIDPDYVDDTWTKADWAVTFIAALIGAMLDVLINQTSAFKGVEQKAKEMLDGSDVEQLKRKLDSFSNGFRGQNSAPIDYQNFDMAGLKSIHEVYSYGHDPLRFIEGICSFISGNYHGIDKFGMPINEAFGEGIPNIIQAVVSYVAHMLSDFLNKQGLPYPGSTFFMQFGSDETRKQIAAAYRGELYNFRTAIYQSLPAVLIGIVINSYAIFSTYAETKKIRLTAGQGDKYQSMLLVANAIVALENISVTTVRGCLGDAHAMFKINWPVVVNTVRLAIKYIVSEKRKIDKNQARIDALQQRTAIPIQQKTTEEYLSDLDAEFELYLTQNGGN